MSQPASKPRGPITLFYESRRFRWALALMALCSILVPIAYFMSYPWTCAFLIRNGVSESSPTFYIVEAFYTPFGWTAGLWPDWLGDLYVGYNRWCLTFCGIPLE